MSSEEIGKLIRARDNRYLLLTPALSDMSSSITLYDLESMKVVASTGRVGVMMMSWVRAKEIEKLVEEIVGSK